MRYRAVLALLAGGVLSGPTTGVRPAAGGVVRDSTPRSHPRAPRDSAPHPAPAYSPEQVIGVQLAALRDPDRPRADAGIATAFAFASPANRTVVGPLARFDALVKSPAYRPLLKHRRAERGRLRVVGAAAEQRVTVTTADGERVSYLFTLTRQPDGPFANCWMIDGVLRMPAFEEEQVVMHVA